MDAQTSPKFARRHYKNGFRDSICLDCFAAIASETEVELPQMEAAHICNPKLKFNAGQAAVKTIPTVAS